MHERDRDKLESDEVEDSFAGCRDDQTKDEEIERLRERVTELEGEKELAMLSAANSFLGRLAIGPELERAAEGWLKKKSIRDPLPAHESAVLFAAMFRRVVRVGTVALLVAAVPIGVLVWQNLLIRDQNQFFREQNELFRKQNEAALSQIEQQADENRRNAGDTLIVRRAQLLATIYDCTDTVFEVPIRDDSGSWTRVETKEKCIPRASKRSRREAVVAFIEIERSNEGDSIDLSGADLTGLTLSGLDLRSVTLANASLFESDLSGADLAGADLVGADLRGAAIFRANLAGARLQSALLVGTDLSWSNLEKADLRGAKLMGAYVRDTSFQDALLVTLNAIEHTGTPWNEVTRITDLSEIVGLSADQLSSACGDAETKLPEGLEHPSNWIPQGRKWRGWANGCQPEERK